MREKARSFSFLLLLAVSLARGGVAQVSNTTPTANPAVIPVPRTEPWWVARHADRLDKVKTGGYELLLVGDSITQNYEKTGPAPDEVFYPIWQEFFAPHKALNLGYSGDQTQHVLWRLKHAEVDGLAPKDIVLLIGTNNTPDKPGGARAQSAEEVMAGVAAVVDELHSLLPAARILLVEILPSAVSVEKSNKDTLVNSLLRLRYAGSGYVKTLDLGYLFVKDGALNQALFYDPRLKNARSPLHPDTIGQRKMAEAISGALFVDGTK